MSTLKKSTGPVAAGPVSNQSTENASIVAPSAVTAKDFAKFAIQGHALQSNTRADGDRVTFVVSRWGQSRNFSHWNDVHAFLAQLGSGGHAVSGAYREIARRNWRITLFHEAAKRAASKGDSVMAAAWWRAAANQGRLPARFGARAAPSGGRS